MKRSPLLLLPFALALLVLPSVRSQERKLSPALAALVESERAFARLSVERGVREAFLTPAADDGINFQPHPTKTKEALRKRPVPTSPPTFTLDWYPIYADISQAGDLGYTTGPYTVTDHSPQQRPTQYGYFFSIWKKQPDGSWKVAVDCGISTPAPPTDAPAPQFHPPSSPHKARAHVSVEAERAALLAADRALLQAESERGVAAALGAELTADARLHRDGMFPVVGRKEIQTYLNGKTWKLAGTPIKTDVAQSGDLGYSYGSYELSDGAKTEKGYYVRIWRRDGDHWRVALDTANPLPPENK